MRHVIARSDLSGAFSWRTVVSGTGTRAVLAESAELVAITDGSAPSNRDDRGLCAPTLVPDQDKDWLLVFGLVNVLATLSFRFRRRIAVMATLLVASLVVLQSHWAPALWLGIVLLGGYLIFSYGRAVASAFTPSRFVRRQIELIRRITGAKSVHEFMSLGAEYKDPALVKYSSAQVQTFQQKIVYNTVLYRGLYFWGYKLEEYSKSATSWVFSLVAFAWLFLKSAMIFTLVNLATYKIDPSQYDVHASPSLLRWGYYSLSGMFANGIPAIEPTAAVAIVLKLVSIIVGPFLLLTLLTNILIDRRQVRQQADLKAAVSEVKVKAKDVDARFANDFEVTLVEAIARLGQLGMGSAIGLKWFLSSLPDDYDAPEPTP